MSIEMFCTDATTSERGRPRPLWAVVPNPNISNLARCTMNIHSVRRFKLSRLGRARGVSCDADGAFIDDVPLLKRVIANGKEKWAPRDSNELSVDLSKHYGLPIDI